MNYLVKPWQTDRQKAMHMSPPCICTGVLKQILRILWQDDVSCDLSLGIPLCSCSLGKINIHCLSSRNFAFTGMQWHDQHVFIFAFVQNSYLTLAHVTFDLDPCDLWPIGPCQRTHKKSLKKSYFWTGDLDLWPMTLTFIRDLDNNYSHHHTELCDHKSNDCRDMNFFPVKKSCFSSWWPWPLTHDLDLQRWPLYHQSPSSHQIWWAYLKWFPSYEFFSSPWFFF